MRISALVERAGALKRHEPVFRIDAESIDDDDWDDANDGGRLDVTERKPAIAAVAEFVR